MVASVKGWTQRSTTTAWAVTTFPEGSSTGCPYAVTGCAEPSSLVLAGTACADRSCSFAGIATQTGVATAITVGVAVATATGTEAEAPSVWRDALRTAALALNAFCAKL